MINKIKKTIFSIVTLAFSFCLLVTLGVFGIYIEAKIGSKIFEIYFGPIPLKVAAGVVILSSFALQDVFMYLHDIKKLAMKIDKSDSSDVFQKKVFKNAFVFFILSKITNVMFLFIAWVYAQLFL